MLQAHQSEGPNTTGEAGRSGIQDPLLMGKSIYWKKQLEDEIETKGKQGYMQSGPMGKVSHCQACLETRPPHEIG